MLWNALAVLLALEVLLPLVLLLAKDRILFHPDASLPAEAGMPRIGAGVLAEVVHCARPDGRTLEAVDARPAGAARAAGAAETGPVVLLLHGNAGNVAFRVGSLGAFVRGTGARVLLASYSGYGGNAGVPSEEEVVADALAAYDHLRATGVPAARIVLYGESLGGAVAAAVAERRECAGLVLQSTFSSVSSMALRSYPWLPLAALLVRGSFPTADRVAALRCPVLVVHGDLDEVVPFSEGKLLHGRAPPLSDMVVVAGAHHDDLVGVAGPGFLAALGARFRKWTAPR